MPPQIQTLQEFAFERSLSFAIGCGLLLLVCILFFAWREAQHVSKRRVAALVILRMIALAILVWMLAGPATRITTREKKQRAVTILVDASGSMTLADPPDKSGNVVRWSFPRPKEGAQLVEVDQVVGALEGLRAELDLAERRGDSSLSRTLQNGIASAIQALESASRNLESKRPSLAESIGETAAALSSARGIENTRPIITAALDRTRRVAEILAEQAESIGNRVPNGTRSRREKAMVWLNDAEQTWLKELGSEASILRYSFAADAQPISLPDWSDLSGVTNAVAVTDMIPPLRRAALDAAQNNAAAIVLISDGGHNAPGDPRQAAAALAGTPLFIVPTGTLKAPRDVLLHHTSAPRAIFKDDEALVEFILTAYDCAGEDLKVELLNKERVLDAQSFAVTDSFFDRRVSFRWKGAALGRHELSVRVGPVSDEFSNENNGADVKVDVMLDTIRALVADDLPRWEYRYLVNLLQRDKHVELYSLLFDEGLAVSGNNGRAGLPSDLEGWKKFQIVVLGDVAPANLPPRQQELLREYVSGGGNLIIVAGESAMPHAFQNQILMTLLPVSAAAQVPDPRVGLRLLLTSEGSSAMATQLADDWLKSEAIWQRMSEKLPVYNLSQYSKPKPASRTLISALERHQTNNTSSAFLSWQHVGLGRVVYLAAPISYQLRYRSGDDYHHRFWGQLMRWAISRDLGEGSRTVRVATDKANYQAGERAEILVRLTALDGTPATGAEPTVEARQNGASRIIPLRAEASAPGEYRGVLNDLSVGPLYLRPVGPLVQSLLAAEGRSEPIELTVPVNPNSETEMRNPVCNLALLEDIAKASGGAVLAPSAVPHALANLNLKAAVHERVAHQPLWNRWGLLWIFVGALTLEWLARKHWGMV